MPAHHERLIDLYGLQWNRAPAHDSIRYALLGLDPTEVEAACRRHAAGLDGERQDLACIEVDPSVKTTIPGK